MAQGDRPYSCSSSSLRLHNLFLCLCADAADRRATGSVRVALLPPHWGDRSFEPQPAGNFPRVRPLPPGVPRSVTETSVSKALPLEASSASPLPAARQRLPQTKRFSPAAKGGPGRTPYRTARQPFRRAQRDNRNSLPTLGRARDQP